VSVQGWVRTRRDSKAGISFVHVSDGSSFHPVQVVAPNTLANYTSDVLHLTAGCAVQATGLVVPSPAKGQPFELQASAIKVLAGSTIPIRIRYNRSRIHSNFCAKSHTCARART
jgi:asparaginyl-tRNA synthetase